MSFLIGVIDAESNIYLAADTKISSASGKCIYDNAHKIFMINEYSAIGCSGHYYFAKRVVENMNKSYKTVNQMMPNLVLSIQQQCKILDAKNGDDLDAVFMLCNQIEYRTCMNLVLFHHRKFSMYDEPFRIERYQYFLAPPDDVPYDACRDIVEKMLLDKHSGTLAQRMSSCVRRIAIQSRVVNDDVDLEIIPRRS